MHLPIRTRLSLGEMVGLLSPIWVVLAETSVTFVEIFYTY